MPIFAGKEVTHEAIVATRKLLDYYNRFLASACERCVNPEERYGRVLTKPEARARLKYLIDVAINRKAGVPDVACRKQDSDYQRALARDARAINDWRGRRLALRLCNLSTRELRARYRGIIPKDYSEDD